MRRLGALALLASLALAAAALGAPAAGVPPPATLLRTFEPVLVLHPDERFQPEAVDGYLADSDLVAGHRDQRLCRAIDGPAALGCYASADAAHAEPPAVYGAVVRSRDRIALEYWLFYAFDLYSPTDPPGEFWQDHEADWESVTVILDAHGKPLQLGLSRHCSGARRDWSRVTRRGPRPVVYVALGSHANSFASGEIPLDRSCWPPVARAIFKAYAVPLRDHAAAGRTIDTATVVPVTATSPSWMTFAGAWGETQYVHFPKNAPFAYGLGPRGPVFHALWRRPVETVLSWPRG